jgi:hypothetical protein
MIELFNYSIEFHVNNEQCYNLFLVYNYIITQILNNTNMLQVRHFRRISFILQNSRSGGVKKMRLPAIKALSKTLIFFLISLLITVTLIDCALAIDSDNDGLDDSEEIKAHTDINDADSDDDGVLDGDEIDWNKNTDGKGDINALDFDSDDDGIWDGVEMRITEANLHNDTDKTKNHFKADADPSTNTSMIHWDTDGDHLGDGEEDKNKNGRYDKDLNESNPLFPDRDGDGAPDYEDDDIDGDGMYNDFEKLYGLDPYDPSDADDDDDNDGFINLREYLGDDNNPGNNDWSDPNNPASKPDLDPIIKISQGKNKLKVEANQSITIDTSILNVTDSEKDWNYGITFKWDWGDGKKEQTIVKQHVGTKGDFRRKHEYLRAGDYTFTLTVIDQYEKESSESIQIIATVPVGEYGTIYDVDSQRAPNEDEPFKDKRTVRRTGWVAYRLLDVQRGETITIEYEVLDLGADVGLRIFIIPANNLDVYKAADPSEKTISRKFNDKWEGHIGTIATKGKIEFTAEDDGEILVIFDNNYYPEYKDTVKIDRPIEYKVEISREDSPVFLILLILVLVIVIVVSIIGFVMYRKLKESKGMTKITREAAIETQRSLDREMAQLELEIQDSLRRGPVRGGGAMAAMPMQAKRQPPPGQPMQRQQVPPPGGTGAAAPGRLPQTPAPAGGAGGTGAGGVGAQPQLPGATPGTAPGQPAQAGGAAQPGTAPGKPPQMLPPAQAPAQPQQAPSPTAQSPTAQSPTAKSPTADQTKQ